jgi:1,4-alpha-glucan branching enzyme
VAAYDTELFGHWWFEGVDWLKEVYRRLSRSEVVEVTSASDYVETHLPEEVLALPESSWGQAGNHFTWLNHETQWMWPLIHQAEGQMEGLVARYPAASASHKEVLDQAARELLLLQSSDWPFLVTTGQAKEYAISRFRGHLDRFSRLRNMLLEDTPDAKMVTYASELFELDKVFPDLDYRVFGEREGRPL